jgi:Transposase DDE domain
MRGRKSPACKRHIVVDTLGLMLGVVVHSAAVQDRDGAEALLRQVRAPSVH